MVTSGSSGDQQEYRYSVTARRRALLWLALSSALLLVLVFVLITQRTQIGLFTQMLGLLLALSQLFTIRAQLSVIATGYSLFADRIELRGLLSRRVIRWDTISEVRRTWLPKLGTRSRWACIVLTRTARGSEIPTLLFNDQLEQAEDVFNMVVERTPHARHVV